MPPLLLQIMRSNAPSFGRLDMPQATPAMEASLGCLAEKKSLHNAHIMCNEQLYFLLQLFSFSFSYVS